MTLCSSSYINRKEPVWDSAWSDFEARTRASLAYFYKRYNQTVLRAGKSNFFYFSVLAACFQDIDGPANFENFIKLDIEILF